MGSLLLLPAELLLMIFKSLENIDDALHLARTCKLLNNTFDSSHRAAIFRSIIVSLRCLGGILPFL